MEDGLGMASRTINIPATTDLDADELTSGTVPFARLSTGSGPADGVWTHLAARFDRGTDAVTVCLNGVESSVSSGASALTGNFLSSTLYLMSRAGSSLYAAGRLAGFAVFPSYITNDQATLLATAA